MKKQSVLQNEIPAELSAEKERLEKLVTEHEINGLFDTVFHELLARNKAQIKQSLEAARAVPADEPLKEKETNGTQDK